MQPSRMIDQVMENVVHRLVWTGVLKLPDQFVAHCLLDQARESLVYPLEPRRKSVELPGEIAYSLACLRFIQISWEIRILGGLYFQSAQTKS